MKRLMCFAACLSALMAATAFGQPAPGMPPRSVPPPSPPFANRLQEILRDATKPPPPLTTFNLDFPGGTPSDLIDAIQKATGKPLNAIIPTEDADVQLPPLKMSDVNVTQLFNALQASSRKTESVHGPYANSYSEVTTDYGFTTTDNPASDTSIWFFHANKPALPPVMSDQKTCQFFQLAPYLDRGFSVDDITTAIQTGWKMAGITSPPELNYHKETRLLIAYGEPAQLATIQNVLGALPTSKMTGNEVDEMNSEISKLQQEVQRLKDQNKELKEKISAGK